MTQIQQKIVAELYKALERLDAPPKLLATVGSWGDTLEEQAVLELLTEWNATGDIAIAPAPRPH